MTFRLVVCLFLTGVVGTARQPPAPSSDQPPTARFGAATSGVVVDVVVRDSRGRPVLGLTRNDFQVYEDGVPQEVVAFEPYQAETPVTVLESAEAAGLVTRAAGAPPRLSEGPPVIALAWDRLTPEGRALAHRAAQRLVRTKAPGELIGVFLTDLSLQTIQPYTTDAARLEAAVERLARTATSSQGREPLPLDGARGRPALSPTASAADGGTSTAGFPILREADFAGDRGGWQIILMLERMEHAYNRHLYEQQGQAAMLGLLALVESLSVLPGRKSVFYFCEGLTIPDSQLPRFRDVIDAANGHNVSVYTFDAAGLRVHSEQQQTAREIRELTFAAVNDAALQARQRGKLTENLEDNERLLKLDSAVALGILADQTGGRMWNNTNALDEAIERASSDRRRYYLLSYVSSNNSRDGAYRRIEVRVNRKDVEVHARRGYRAAAADAASPVLEYERPAYAALEASQAPAAFPIAARALRSPLPGRPGLTSVLVGVEGKSLTLGRNDDGSQFYAGATVLSRIVDPSSREVARASQQFEFTGDWERRDLTPRNVLYFRTASLPPSPHTLEVAVHDSMGQRNSVLRLPVPHGTAADQPLAGDVYMVIREQPVTGQAGAGTHPLVWNDVLFTPALGGTLPLNALPMITVAWPLVVPGPAPRVEVELRRGELMVGRFDIEPAVPDADGRLLAIGRLHPGALDPGTYAVVATAHTPDRQLRATTTLTFR